jgi:adenine specific DNA methylase Mod
MAELIWEGKYDEQGRKVAPLRIALPFQTVETVNEAAADRDRMQDLFEAGRPTEWRNRLVWGDKKYVLPSLLEEFAGKVNLIYIDPPFDTGADFTYSATIPDDPNTPGDQGGAFLKQPSAIEEKAYRDTWGENQARYPKWLYETVVLLRDLLADDGSLYLHLDWHKGHQARMILDEVFGVENFRNELHWYYYNKMHDSRKGQFPRATDTIFFYTKNSRTAYTFNQQVEEREAPVKQLVRKKVGGKMVNVKDEAGNLVYQVRDVRVVDNVWRIPLVPPASIAENTGYPTQKPEALLDRIIRASSNEGDTVLDCFCGSGTTAAVAEKLGRKWITCDLGRFAIHTARKRLLGIPGVKPFVVQNLGKYERQAWAAAEFGALYPNSTRQFG